LIVIEATLVFTISGLCLIAGGIYNDWLLTIGATLLVAAVALPAIRSQCERYAIAQVRAILADPARAATVRVAFAELTGEQRSHRRAA
jgi:hypothetical protein